ncbi:hypothetical protein BO83DRAFT_381467 [Aspergillus eucalypticola CBS 122712]|uniref:Plasma membrane proteolipid 3 n=1 Tax=Aspergillus eucalypticola (strain CBS 122712 / IBT 29274) TaxID=1448314 RepID=A0A317UYC7_ASPEC|nr:uncharacterized protein BO83DRAFT_381467 [Aspergillus eucalypticola CBS 122712]PWY65537.1 hypothetical protein BO83DRAFT_381467 [Aspergillus eucalypticola CBS 122712]
MPGKVYALPCYTLSMRMILIKSHNSGCCEIIIAFFLPFVGVFMRTGCSCDLLINICLCILGWVPGVIHA